VIAHSPSRRLSFRRALFYRTSPRRRWLPRVLSGRAIRVALLVGFGLAFALWGFAGHRVTQRMTDLESKDAAMSQHYMRAQDALSTIRDQVLVASVFARDALSDRRSGASSNMRRFEASRRRWNQALRSYAPVTNASEERRLVDELRTRIDDFHQGVLDALAPANGPRPVDAQTMFRQRVLAKRDAVLRVSDELQAFNRAAFIEERTETSELSGGTEVWLWERLGFALAIIGIIGLFATYYAGGLERRVRRQQARAGKTATELQRLSARLLTAQEDERRVIARELHDEVGQVLTAVKLELALASKALASKPETAARIEEARRTIDDSIRTVRDLSHLLHPALLDDLGLVRALRRLVDSFGRRYGLECELRDTNVDTRLDPELETTVYRIVQEALSNVVKHANARCCLVTIDRREGSLLLTIEDDGVGFRPRALQQPSASRGLGLIGIRERVAQFGGTLTLASRSTGRGVRLEIELPAHWRSATGPVATVFKREQAIGAEAAHLSRG
jgi:signal transduction histidine kinase